MSLLSLVDGVLIKCIAFSFRLLLWKVMWILLITFDGKIFFRYVLNMYIVNGRSVSLFVMMVD